MGIDARLLDTDNRFFDYCRRRGIKDPFQERQDKWSARYSVENQDGQVVTIIRELTEEEKEWDSRQVQKIKEYLRLRHTFRLWDFHFWMNRAAFEQHLHWSEDYADTSIYMPCDTVERQCALTCAHFGGKCPREEGELKTPQILGFEGRWEFHDDTGSR